MHLLRRASVLILLIAGNHGVAAAQTASDFYYHAGELVGVVVHLDTLGIVARAGAAPAVDDSVSRYGLTLAREIAGELRIYALDSALSREGVFALAAQIETEQATVVGSAGPLLRTVGGRFGLVATSQLIVQFRPTVQTRTIDSLTDALGLAVVARTPFTRNHFLLRRTSRSPGDVLRLAQQLHVHPLVQRTYPDFLDAEHPAAPSPRAGASRPGRGLATAPWHLSNDGTGGGTAGADIQAVDAWGIEQGSPGTVIAIIEPGGFDVTHPDLAPNLWVNPGEMGADEDGNGFIGDRNGWNFKPCIATVPVTSASSPGLSIPCGSSKLADPLSLSNAHGTAVAGLAAAVPSTPLGMSGVCPQCRLMLVRTGLSWYARYLAFLYAASEGAAVINASWNVGRKTEIAWAVVEAATAYDVPIAVAAHHDITTDEDECTAPNLWMTSVPEVIAIVGTDDDDLRIGPAGFGSCMGLAAPGGRSGTFVGITTTDVVGAAGYNNAVGVPGCVEPADRNYTRCFGGTSAAAPLVSGTIGLLRSQDPTRTRAQVTDLLYATAEKVGPLSYAGGFNAFYGHGRVNAFCALGGTGPRCPVEAPVTEEEEAAGSFEFGVRVGFTARTDAGGTETTTNLPGSGPLGLPVLYADWFAATNVLVDLQLGTEVLTTSLGDEYGITAALQPGLAYPLGGGLVYGGPNVALHATKSGGPWVTDWALGGALGFRIKLKPFLAMRFEGRYRYWLGPAVHETGIALGFGVIP